MVYSPYRNEVMEEEDTLDGADYQLELYKDLVANLENAYEAGLIDEDEFVEYKENAYLELQERLADEFDIDVVSPDELDELEYAGDMGNLAEFASAVDTRFGAAVLELGQLAGYDDVEEYIVDLADELGYDPDYLVATITGDAEPDDEDAVAIAELMDLPEDYAIDLLASAYEARGEDLYDYLESEDEYNDEDDSDDVLEEVVEAVDYKMNDLESRLAEFEVAGAIKDAMSEVESDVYRGLDQGWLTPNMAREILGEFERDEDRVAAFSQLANSNGVDMSTQLFGMQFALKLLENSGGTATFGAYVQDEIEVSPDEYKQAKANVLYRMQQFGN